MDLDIKDDFRLLDYLNKCRCCFEKLNYNENQMEITEIIEEQFLELTQIELKTSPIYSNIICLKCTNELQSISSFRSDLITKQQRLYNFVTTSQYEIQDAVKFEPVYIKIETQSSDELVNIFKYESQYEEIEKSEVLVSEVKIKSPKRFSLRQLKAIELKDEIKKHTQQKHNKKPKVKKKSNKIKKICPHCGIMISRNLSVHIRRVHLKEKNVFCDLCGYGSITKCGIVQHMLIHLPKSMREKLHCSKCEFVSLRAPAMRAHVRNCNGLEGKIDCVCFCGKVFSNKIRLNCHVTNTHQRKRDHICTVCRKAFTYKNQLKEHMESHSGKIRKRETACEVCGKMFFTVTHLKSHMIGHRDPKYVCDFEGCTKKFFKPNRLETHKKTHIGLRDLPCHLCDKKFYSTNHLYIHVKKVHKKLKTAQKTQT